MIAFDRDFATLRDNFGNSYKRIHFGIGTRVVDAVERSESLYPGKSLKDVVVFELPIDTAQYLNLELPAINFGGEGMIRFRIPHEMFRPDISAFNIASPEEVAAKKAADEAKRKHEEAERKNMELARQRVEEATRNAEAQYAGLEEAKFRAWTSTAGTTVEAKLISYANGSVTLESRQGKRTRVALDKLSDADNEYVKKWWEERK